MQVLLELLSVAISFNHYSWMKISVFTALPVSFEHNRALKAPSNLSNILL